MGDADGDDERSTRQREALRSFMAAHSLKAHPWAIRAGVSTGSIYAFLKGHSSYLSLPVAQKLAAVVGASVAAILGDEESPPPATSKITHHLRGDDLVPLARPGKRRAPTPRDAEAERMKIAEVQHAAARMLPIGSLIYWHDTPVPLADAARRICVIDVAGRGLVLGDLRTGFGEGRALIVGCSGTVIDDADVLAAYPVEWIKPS